MTSTASTSNPPLFLIPFGLQPASQPLQRPIHLFFSLLLDFLSGLLYFNVQSNTFSHPVWTSSVASTASTSNPPLFLTPFGLQPASQPLQRPICHIFLLTFYIYIRNSSQKSLTLHHYLPQSSHLLPTMQKTPAGTSPAGVFEKHTNY
mgnify:CR=1 FL=1